MCNIFPYICDSIILYNLLDNKTPKKSCIKQTKEESCKIYDVISFFYICFQQMLKLQKEQDDLLAGNGNGGGPPQVNICPPSPQNNDPDNKTGNFA